MQEVLSGNTLSSHKCVLVKGDCAMTRWQSPGLVLGIFYGKLCAWKLNTAELYHLCPFVNVSPSICAI